MAEERKIKDLLTYEGPGWWNLPKTPQEEPEPKYEGPIGGPWFKQMWDWMTYAGRSHASVRLYLVVAIVLSVVTYVEFRLFDVNALGASGRNAMMLVLSAFKFTMVVAFFMHLRFDNKYYSWIFTSCMVLGLAIFLAVLLIQRHHGFGL